MLVRRQVDSELHICNIDRRASHARTFLPAALASVSFGSGPEGSELGGYEANAEFKAATTGTAGLSGTQARVTMVVVIAVCVIWVYIRSSSNSLP